MSNLIKQVIGIDCSCETLDCAYGSLDANANQQIQSSTQFKNDTSGFKKLLAWTAKRAASGVPLRFIVEATGVYHERLADFLVASDCEVSVVVFFCFCFFFCFFVFFFFFVVVVVFL